MRKLVNIKNNIWDKCQIIYKIILENIIMPSGDLFAGTRVMKTLNRWRRISRYSEEEIQSLSNEKLLQVLNCATARVPFYRKYAQYRTCNPCQWLKCFPVMYKNDIKKNLDELTSVPKETLMECVSSGSSGVQSIIYKSKHDVSNGRALTLLIWEWGGFYPGKPILQTGMTIKRGFIKKAKDLLLRTRYYIAFGLNDVDIKALLERQVGKRNYHLVGYASSLYVLADTYIRLGMTGVAFDKAISLGDKMFPHYRKRIKDAFGCEVIDTYGLSEDLTIAAQKDLEYYYILSPHVHVELLDSKGNEVEDGELGYVVATSLDAYAMPLIRFYTGDLAIRLPKDKYPKQREMNFPLLEKIIGRDTDIVKTRSGKSMIVHFFTGIFEFIPEIIQFQVIQHNLDEIEINYIPCEDFSEQTLRNIELQIHSYLNEKYSIIWRKVNVIHPTPSGKPQIIKSYLAEEERYANLAGQRH